MINLLEKFDLFLFAAGFIVGWIIWSILDKRN